MSEARPKGLLWLAVVALAYGAAHHWGLIFVDPLAHASAVWPASGVGLAALLLAARPQRRYLLFTFGAIKVLADLWGGGSLTSSLGPLVASVLELYAAVWLFEGAGGDVRFERVADVVALLAAATLGALLGGAVAAGSAVWVHSAELGRAFVTWWVGDALGMMMIAPLALAWAGLSRTSRDLKLPGLLEAVAFLLLWGGSSWLAFHGDPGASSITPPPYALIALLAWPALRLGQRWVALGLVVLLINAGTGLRDGLFNTGEGSAAEGLLLLQSYLAFSAGSALLFAASVGERRAAEAASRRAEEQSRRLSESLELALEAGSMGTWEWHPVTNETFWSPNIDAVLARPPGSFARSYEAYMALVHPEDRPQVQGAIDAVVARGSGSYTSQHRIEAADGSYRWMESKGRLDADAAGKPLRMAGTLVDITERKRTERAEERNRQLQEQLRQAQKLEALGTLAGGIAHDFNNILSAIVAYTQIAQLDNPSNSELQSQLGEVLHASSRAANLVQQILSFSRQQPQERKTMSISPVFREALKLLRSTLPATIEIREQVAGNLPEVMADPTQMHQVLMNLCTNASHAMKGRGELQLELSRYRLSEGESTPHLELRPGDYLRLAVRDTGEGMDEQVLSRIFEPFFTTKPSGEGTGLGLAVVHGIIKEHEGVIMAESQPGQGSTFSVFLPSAPSTQSLADEVLADVPLGHGEQVLFVDDEAALCTAARHMLTRLGYAPRVFQDPQAAWQAFSDAPNGYDIVITDLTMPRRTGLELANDMLRLRPGLPIILSSGYSATLTPEMLEELGIRELLYKPLDYRALAEALARALPRRLGQTA